MPHAGWPTVKIKPVGEMTENSQSREIKIRIRRPFLARAYLSSSFIRSISSSPSSSPPRDVSWGGDETRTQKGRFILRAVFIIEIAKVERDGRSLFAFFTTANANGARIRSPFARLPAEGCPRIARHYRHLTATTEIIKCRSLADVETR